MASGARAQVPRRMWNLPGTRIETGSPALAGRFFFKKHFVLCSVAQSCLRLCGPVVCYLIYWPLLRWVFAACGLSLAAESEGCTGFSLRWPLLLQRRGCGHVGSVVVVPGLSCPEACGILSDQRWNSCPLPWRVDSFFFFNWKIIALEYCIWQVILNPWATREVPRGAYFLVVQLPFLGT